MFAASIHVAVACAPTLRQVTVRRKSDEGGALGAAETAPGTVKRARQRRVTDIFEKCWVPCFDSIGILVFFCLKFDNGKYRMLTSLPCFLLLLPYIY